MTHLSKITLVAAITWLSCSAQSTSFYASLAYKGSVEKFQKTAQLNALYDPAPTDTSNNGKKNPFSDINLTELREVKEHYESVLTKLDAFLAETLQKTQKTSNEQIELLKGRIARKDGDIVQLQEDIAKKSKVVKIASVASAFCGGNTKPFLKKTKDFMAKGDEQSRVDMENQVASLQAELIALKQSLTDAMKPNDPAELKASKTAIEKIEADIQSTKDIITKVTDRAVVLNESKIMNTLASTLNDLAGCPLPQGLSSVNAEILKKCRVFYFGKFSDSSTLKKKPACATLTAESTHDAITECLKSL